MGSEVKRKTVHELLWEKLTRGVTDKLDNDGVRIDKWSPNNLRRLIVSPEGVIFQPFLTKGTFFHTPLGVVEFPISEETQADLQGKKTVTSILYQKRVFSSVEEIVIIPNSPTVPYSLNPNEVRGIFNKASSFKRLGSVVILKESVDLKNFLYTNTGAMLDRYSLLATSDKAQLGDCKKLQGAKNWYKHTSLRPQFYSLDEQGKALSDYFKDVEENLTNLEKESVSSRTKRVKDDNEKDLNKNSFSPISKSAKEAIMYRQIQLGLYKNNLLPINKLSLVGEYVKSEVKQIKEGQGFRFDDDVVNSKLKQIGFYDEGGKSDSDSLVRLLGNQVVKSVFGELIPSLKVDYPVFAVSLEKTLKKELASIKSKSTLTIKMIKKITTFDYRDDFRYDMILTESEVTDSQRSQLVSALSSTEKEKIEDLVRGILFDLDYPPDAVSITYNNEGRLADISTNNEGLDLVVLHDLYIYVNSVNNRMYSSLFSSERDGNKGYVNDQSVSDRVKLLLRGVSPNEDEYQKCLDVARSITSETLRESFKPSHEVFSSLERGLIPLGIMDEDARRQAVVRSVADVIVELSMYKETRIALHYLFARLGIKEKLGVSNYRNKSEGIVRELFDTNKEESRSYSDYLVFLKDLVVKRK